MVRERTRESWIDVAKGLAILFVVMGHVVTSYRNSGILKDAVAFNFICDFLYVFHMPLFFVISGYLNGKSKREDSLHLALLRKCVTYGIPYLVFSVVAVGLNIVSSAVTNTKLGIMDLVWIPVYPISSLWFIYALLIISIVQLLIKGLFSGRKGKAVLLTVSFAVKIAAHLLGELQVVKDSGFSQCVLFDAGKYWFWYVLGEGVTSAFSAKRRQVFEKFPNWICFAAAVVYAGIIYALWYYGIAFLLLDIVLSAIGVLLCCIWGMKISQSHLLESLGKQTFPIYLLHGYVISFARILLTRLHIPLFSGLMPMLLCTALGVILPLVAYGISVRIRGLDFVFYPGKYVFAGRDRYKNDE